ncbi:peptidase T [uncultured Selenomonas sp.]|jgi:tripeptide aminopeptidase|uniref:peptidase T n=1 Tax=uncultured Selenomonas sp. TaxID=159275 RepID=UPI0025F5A73A|nr:peptidase T [uncultured Selenomonas sp.]MDD6128759.1 peptidase T [Veillonellaceae bacterium]MDD6699009.1 peptidase T [Veillonellaceae bacterium]
MELELSMETLVKRFKDYISYNTQSDEDNDKECPSTPGQMVFAKHLAEELKDIGLSDVTLDAHGYIMATLPANDGGAGKTIGFISHLDTAPDAPGGPMHPRIVKDYDGKDIVLNEKENVILSPNEFPELLDYKGQDIMVTDGLTLLGADDKAGLTAIVTAAEYLVNHPGVKHGTIRIGVTPDEETGRSATLFDVEKFGADFAYTVDGGAIGGLEYETFNAANPIITFHGRSVHTGDAKGKMLNALTLAAEWQNLLPAGEKPEYTEGYEGFFHVYKISGGVETCTMHMLVRDHDRAKFEERKAFLNKLAAFFNERYGAGTVEVTPHDVYYNMREKIEDGNMYVVDLAKEAMREAGIEPVISPVRGGTDGSQLSFRGLPCPNLFTGGLNYHGRYEYLPLPSLKAAAETTLHLMVLAGKAH